VAALVEKVEADHTVVRLINLNPLDERDVVIQAGAFGEHCFTAVDYTQRTSEYPGAQEDYDAPQLKTKSQHVAVDDKRLYVKLPPATEIVLDLQMQRFVNDPSYTLPWE
jgi:hypothetical protein